MPKILYPQYLPEDKQENIDFKKKYLIWVYIIISGFCCIGFSGCFTTEYNVATHKQDIIFYSTEKEIAMGKNINKIIHKEFGMSKNSRSIGRVNEIANKIVKVIDRMELNYYFYIIDLDKKETSHVNAFSLPGGYVYFYNELVELLTDDELAFVIAHEVGHIVSRHQIKRLQATMGYNFLMIASIGAKSDDDFSSGLSFALAQILTGYSREDEFTADELAVKYCDLAGFDPLAGIAVIEKLYKEGKKKTHPISYFRTHPYSSQRIRNIKEMLHLPLDATDYINF
ncbi:MAG: M48 family metalloprotease [Candidatus Omnitrophica bacterium]|nr:M48 family metalloprotease [Candidatus Omnitrophota bacterium]